MKSMDWAEQSACRDEDPILFFPGKNGAGPKADALELCGICPVATACLDWHMDIEARVPVEEAKYGGIAGGMTGYERWRLRQRLRIEAAS